MNQNIIDTIKLSNKIAILTHIKPDPDAYGSAKALQLILQKLGKIAHTYCADDNKNNFEYLNFDNYYLKKPYPKYDLCIVVDCSDITRVGKTINVFYKTKNGINIDHHYDNSYFAKYNYVDDKSSSTGSLIYELMIALGVELDDEIATCLYSAIAGDTQCFCLANTSATDFEIASKLVKVSTKINIINYQLFKKRTQSQIELIKYALNNMEFLFNQKAVLIIIPNRVLLQTKCTFNETYVVTHLLSSIDEAEISIVATEQVDNEFSISLRSKNISAQKIAKKFGGGGHILASGFKVVGNEEEVRNAIINGLNGEL